MEMIGELERSAQKRNEYRVFFEGLAKNNGQKESKLVIFSH